MKHIQGGSGRPRTLLKAQHRSAGPGGPEPVVLEPVVQVISGADGQEPHEFKEGYTAHRAWLDERRELQKKARHKDRRPSAQRRAQTKAAQREQNQRAREVQTLEHTIQSLELRLTELTQALEQAGAAQNLDLVRELGIEYNQVESELRSYMAQWAEVAG